MPVVTIDVDGKSLDIETGAPLKELEGLESTSLVFGCKSGNCGSCAIEVLEGEDNMSDKSSEEVAMLEMLMLEDNCRLACQCCIDGDVTINPVG